MKKEKDNTKAKKVTCKDTFLKYKSRLCSIKLSTWYFSIFFFVTIFFVSMWVWWVGFYNPKPSQQVITKFESSRENFEAMKSNTENAIETLKSRKERTSSPQDFSGQRDLFLDYKKLEALQPKPEEEFLPEIPEQIPVSQPESEIAQ